MQCFDCVNPWPSKVNYVDASNRVLGFDIMSGCCEVFGHGVFDHIPTDPERVGAPDISAYSFADEKPTDCLPDSDAGGGLAFRITAQDKPDLWVCIWNHHNGYYSHGWTFGNLDGRL